MWYVVIDQFQEPLIYKVHFADNTDVQTQTCYLKLTIFHHVLVTFT